MAKHKESMHNPISLHVKTTEEVKVDDDVLLLNNQNGGLDPSPSGVDIPMSSAGFVRTR